MPRSCCKDPCSSVGRSRYLDVSSRSPVSRFLSSPNESAQGAPRHGPSLGQLYERLQRLCTRAICQTKCPAAGTTNIQCGTKSFERVLSPGPNDPYATLVHWRLYKAMNVFLPKTASNDEAAMIDFRPQVYRAWNVGCGNAHLPCTIRPCEILTKRPSAISGYLDALLGARLYCATRTRNPIISKMWV